MQREEFKSHLYFHVVDVRSEAQDDPRVVRVVFAVSYVDVHINLVFVVFNHHSGEVHENREHAVCNARFPPLGGSHALEACAAVEAY